MPPTGSPAVSTAAPAGAVRVTVSGGQRRADLALPGSVPVAELVPELADILGLLDVTTAHEPLQVSTTTGERLADELGLGPQGVSDGAVLLVTTTESAAPIPRHDDVADAVAEVVERSVVPWSAAAARRTTSGTAGVLLAVGLAALLLWPSPWSAAVAGALAVALAAVAAVADRRRGDRALAVGATWCAAAHGAVSGMLAIPEDATALGGVLAAAGLGLVVGGLACALVLGSARVQALPPVLLGGLAGVLGLAGAAGADVDVVAPLTLVVLVLAGNVVPRLALGATGLHASRGVAAPDSAAALAADVRAGHDLLFAGEVALGVGVVVLTPPVVLAGSWGAALASAAAFVVLLRSRHRRSGGQVQAAVTAGVAVLVVGAVTLLLGHPPWRPVLALVAPATALLALVLVLVGARPGVRLRRWADVAETLAIVALLPLLVLTVGWFDAVRG